MKKPLSGMPPQLAMSTLRQLTLGVWLTLGIFLASPLCADEFGGLSGAFQRAQEMLKESRRTSTPRPAGRNWNEYVNYSDQTQRAAQEAATRLAEMETQLGVLDAATRAYLDQHTTQADRSSLASLLDAVMHLQRETHARQYELQMRVSELRARMRRLNGRLGALELEASDLRATRQTMSVDLAELRAQAAAMTERAVRLEGALAQASSLTAELQTFSGVARTAYWTEVGDWFARLELGTPRDYTARVEADTAMTQRRVRRTSTGPVLIPPLTMPVSVQPMVAAAPVYAMPALAAAVPVAPVKEAPTLARAVDDWLKAARSLYRSQGEVDSLLGGLQSTEDALERRAAEIEHARAEARGLRSTLAQAAAELNRQSQKVEELHVRLPETLTRGLKALSEGLFWAHAQAALATVMRSASHHAELAAHFTWVVRSYTTLLRDDLPTAVEVLGPNPSEEALAKFDRLTHLTELYVADRETSLIFAKVTSSEESGASRGQGRGVSERAVVGQAAEPLGETEVYRRQKANLDEFIRQTRLGFDKAHEGKFNLAQADLGLRIENHLGKKLISDQHRGHDFSLVDDLNYKIDGMQVVSHPSFKLKEFEGSLKRHLEKSHDLDAVFINVPEGVSAQRRAEVLKLIESLLPDDRGRVIVLESTLP